MFGVKHDTIFPLPNLKTFFLRETYGQNLRTSALKRITIDIHREVALPIFLRKIYDRHSAPLPCKSSRPLQLHMLIIC